LLDPSAHPDAPPREPFRLNACGCEATLISLQNRNSEILGPPSSEVDVDRGSAFTHRYHLAFDQRKATALGLHIGGGVGVEEVIIRNGPEAKLGLARRRAFARADPAADAGKSPGKQVGLDRAFDPLAGRRRV